MISVLVFSPVRKLLYFSFFFNHWFSFDIPLYMNLVGVVIVSRPPYSSHFLLLFDLTPHSPPLFSLWWWFQIWIVCCSLLLLGCTTLLGDRLCFRFVYCGWTAINVNWQRDNNFHYQIWYKFQFKFKFKFMTSSILDVVAFFVFFFFLIIFFKFYQTKKERSSSTRIISLFFF